MKEKYTIEEFINKNILVECNLNEAKIIADEVRKKGINTSKIDKLTEDKELHLEVLNGELTNVNALSPKHLCNYKIVKFDDFDFEIKKDRYTIQDLIENDILIKCNYLQRKKIGDIVKDLKFNTFSIENEVYPYHGDVYIELIDNTVILHFDVLDNQYIDYEKYKLIDYDKLVIHDEMNIKENNHKNFKLEEIVRCVLYAKDMIDDRIKKYGHKNGKNVTAFITAIDNEKNMCEIVFLHNVHISKWVSCSQLYHIEHIYEVGGDDCV